MPRTPLAALTPSNARPETPDFPFFNADDFAPGRGIVRVSLSGETLYVNAADWERAGDYLVARYPGAGAPRVDQPAPPSALVAAPAAAPAQTPTTLTIARSAPLPAAPAPVRGVTVDLEGAIRSGADLEAAERAGFAPAQPYFTRGTMVIDLGVQNARRSRIEHDAKPSVREAATDFVRRVGEEQRRDEIVRVNDLVMNPDGSIFDVDTEARYLLARRAFNGFCSQLGFGGGSYLAKCWPELRRHNVNAWLESIAYEAAQARAAHEAAQAKLAPAKRRDFEDAMLKFRTRNGANAREVYGVVSPSYAVFDVDLVAEALMLAAPADAKCVIDYDGTRARFEVMFHTDVLPEKFVAGEFFKAGVIITTDDTGGGALSGEAAAYQNLCLNLICIDDARVPTFSIRHVGTVQAMVEKFRAGFARSLKKIDHFLTAWNYAVEDNVVEAARVADADVPMKVEEALPGIFTAIVERELVPVRGRVVDAVPALMRMWGEDKSAAAGPTRAAVVNAFTRYAHKVNDDAFFADEISKKASALLYGRRGSKPAPLPWQPVDA